MSTDTTKTEEDLARESFEEWYSNGGEYPRSIRRNEDGTYTMIQANTGWVAWLEAWNRRAALAAPPEPAPSWLTKAKDRLGSARIAVGGDLHLLEMAVAAYEKGCPATPPQEAPAPATPILDDRISTLVNALVASKSWMRGYAEAYVQEAIEADNLLDIYEQRAMLQDPRSILMLADWHDFQQDQSDAMGAETTGNGRRATQLRDLASQTVAVDPDIWPAEEWCLRMARLESESGVDIEAGADPTTALRESGAVGDVGADELAEFRRWKADRDERTRKRGAYWLTPEGRSEIRETFDGEDDCVRPLLDALEAAERAATQPQAVQAELLTDERIEELAVKPEFWFGSLPNSFRWPEFARAIEAEVRATLSAAPSAASKVGAKLNQAIERMDRARSILTNDNPRPDCNWGMLDTSDLKGHDDNA